MVHASHKRNLDNALGFAYDMTKMIRIHVEDVVGESLGGKLHRYEAGGEFRVDGSRYVRFRRLLPTSTKWRLPTTCTMGTMRIDFAVNMACHARCETSGD
jgi:hypothetical protein